MYAFIHRVFQLYAIFNQSDIGPLIGRVEVVAARLVSCLCVFLFFFHFALWTYLGQLSFVSEPCPRRFRRFQSRLSVSVSPRRSRLGAQELCEHGEVQLSSHILSLSSPPQ